LLAAVFFAAVVATVVSTVLVMVRMPSRHPGPATPRGLAALLALAPLSSGPLVVLALGGTLRAVVGAAVVLVVADVLWLRLTRRWSWRGHAAWVATTTLSLSFLAYMLTASIAPGRGGLGTSAALLLWLVEVAVFALGFAYLWEVLDVTSRREWRRRLPDGLVGEPRSFPFVSLHVPAHNEPPDMVIETLRSLVALDYPAFEVVMVDDNTVDPALWHPLRDWCAAYDGPVPVRFVHLEDWPGFKSGALNYVLQHVTDPRAEVIGVVDADYVVEADYLRRTAPLFAERPRLGFVQTPQNYREWEHAPYLRRLFYSYEYFFRVSQVSRNELDAAIFGGTMGLIRRSALEEVGGWDEWCITEDAEVSLKMLRAGWSGQHVERAFGHGVMPLTFEALKRQRFRWCFGGVQILKAHWRSLMPWDRSPSNHLTQAQRWAYLSGGLQWFGDVLALAFAAILGVAGLSLAFGGDLVLRRFAGMLLVLPPLLLALVVVRAVVVLRLRSDATLRDSVGALLLWLALGWTVALACVRGLIQPEGVFLRTPKTREEPSVRDAVRANRVETVLGLGLLAIGVAVLLQGITLPAVALVTMLGWHAVGLLGAPVSSIAAMRAELTRPCAADGRASGCASGCRWACDPCGWAPARWHWPPSRCSAFPWRPPRAAPAGDLPTCSASCGARHRCRAGCSARRRPCLSRSRRQSPRPGGHPDRPRRRSSRSRRRRWRPSRRSRLRSRRPLPPRPHRGRRRRHPRRARHPRPPLRPRPLRRRQRRGGPPPLPPRPVSPRAAARRRAGLPGGGPAPAEAAARRRPDVDVTTTSSVVTRLLVLDGQAPSRQPGGARR
jgi:cellulose synthase/poly-beta-1,6-N-acetylglucosamine synthase-like glycosyltransferase